MTRFLVHDLKNHLGCVLGYAEMLLNRARNKDQTRRDVEVLERVKRQASQMANAVGNLLDLARLEELPGIKRQPVRALTVLENGLASAALPPGQTQPHIDRRIDPGLEVACDSPLLTRVLSNLVLNAVKHNRKGVVVTLSAYRRERAVVFECRDTGDGIPDEIAERLFDEFSTSGGRDQFTASHGLGLAFCRVAVAAHGGRIWVETKPGQGTTFAFTIPDEGTDT
jgi:signal transduction histidine kinase